MNPELNYIIVTNTYKRPISLVERSIKASLNQKVKPQRVFLLDQNQPQIELSKEIEENLVFKHEKINFNSVSAARNSLIIPANADWIFFCDDDGFPAENYSENLLKRINENTEIEILAGNILREDTKTNYTLRQKNFGSLKYFRFTKKLMGSNFVIKAKVFDELGRFDENFGVGSYWGSGEETDFCWKAYFSGKKMEFFQDLVVYHVPPFHESIKKGFKKSFNYGVGKGALVWKWLFKKRKIKVVYELVEMAVVPFILMLKGLLTLKPQLIATHFASFSGRVYGIVKAVFVNK